jgi:hypothetical protein
MLGAKLAPRVENPFKNCPQELLYPPLRELAAKYPDWLADNRAALTDAEFNSYNRQGSIFTKLFFGRKTFWLNFHPQILEKITPEPTDIKISEGSF